MSWPSPARLRILHALRLLGYGDSRAIADRAQVAEPEASEALHEAAAQGWIERFAFADQEGWSLTEPGRVENERQLAREREQADPDGQIIAVYREFLPLNARLLRACTDWQLTPSAAGRFAPNDHTNAAWDRRVLAELGGLNASLSPLVARLVGVLDRFAGYDHRFEAALRRAQLGDHDWVDRTHVDSCHLVWFQLHEDLLATLGLQRGEEITLTP